MVELKQKTVFVTVGTTLFNGLIEAIVSKEALDWLASKGFTRLTIQYGKGIAPRTPDNCSLELVCYDFKPSLMEDMLKADLIVSHAGAGTIMEVLGLTVKQKTLKLAVVINSQLMDNHQLELARAMGDRKHLFVVTESGLLRQKRIWDELEDFVQIPKTPGDTNDFARIMENYFGLSKLK